MKAELGVLATLVDDQDHDKQEGAGEQRQTHGHRNLPEQAEARLYSPLYRAFNLKFPCRRTTKTRLS